jgi:hypothetical protein
MTGILIKRGNWDTVTNQKRTPYEDGRECGGASNKPRNTKDYQQTVRN